MVICAVIGCHNRTGRDDALVKFYRVPTVRQNCNPNMRALVTNRRALWLLRICREDLDDARATKNGSRVCSKHFVSGSPSIVEDITNPDWAPSLHLGHDFFNGKRKLQEIKEESTQKCEYDSQVSSSKYQRNYKKSLKNEITDDDDNEEEEDTYARKYPCCVMHDDFSQIERSMSSPKVVMSDTSESSSEAKDYITGTSTDPHNTTIQLKDVDSRTEIATRSEDNFSDADNIESVQKDNLHKIRSDCTQRKTNSKTISEPKNFNESALINCVTHGEAFSAAETLLRYIMNQDIVNDSDVNFTLNLAQKIKAKIN